MSRTGVGCRVMIDGTQLDDGCLDWGAGHWDAPWTETRRNLMQVPQFVAGSTWSFVGATVTYLPGGVVDLVQVTASSNNWVTPGAAGWFGNGIFVAGDPASVGYQVQNVGTVAATFRIGCWSGAVYLYGPYVTVAPGESRRVTAEGLVTPAGAAYMQGRLHGAVPVGAHLRVSQPIQTKSATIGPYFDGTTAPVGDKRHRWLGAVNASASVEEVGTWVSDPPPVVGPGVFGTDGLAITWGRSSTVDQPESSTCTFAVVDEEGPPGVRQLLHIGGRVEVFADAEVSGDPVLPAFTDPGFEAGLRVLTSNAVGTRRQVPGPGSGAVSWAAILQPVGPAAWSGVFPPAAFQAAGQNPDAWDDLPVTSGGETWTIRAQVWASAGVTISLTPVYFTGPYADAWQVVRGASMTLPPGNMDWHATPAAVSFTPEVAGMWVGFQVEAWGALPWDDFPDAITWDALQGTGWAWDDFRQVRVDQVEILAPESVSISRLVFAGRITDLTAAWAAEWDAARVAVTAADYWADLGNRYVGEEPWPQEPVAARIARITTAAQVPGEPPVTADLAATLAGIPMSWDDVDNQPAANLLHEVAQSVDGVMWSATHRVSGPYLKLEDPGTRVALYELALVGGVIIIVPADFTGEPVAPVDLSACDVLRDPVQILTDVGDLGTRALVEWQEAITTPEGEPGLEAHTVTVIDAGREVIAGTRAVSVGTLLTAEPDAVRVADRLLARLNGAWRVAGLVVADADFITPDRYAAQILLTLLDGVDRGGLPLRVTDLPEWSPVGSTAGCYLEGGEYTFTEGGWSLALTVSRATGQGASAQWDQLTPTWQWDQWDPTLTWDTLRGVAGPATPANQPV